MDIYMTGINYNNADIEYREKFSLTTEQQDIIAKKLIDSKIAKGCIFLSTCNRTELWISGNNSLSLDFFINEVLGDEEIDFLIKEDIKKCFIVRQGEEAVDYLLELACGIHSQIFGEDQILTQLKVATDNARKSGYIDSILETLFRTAITGAKKVKTEVILTNKNRSLPETIISQLEGMYGSLKEKKCLVIGNGEMGRLMASNLVDVGANVEMTLRQYKKKQAIIPSGCGVVLYEERCNGIEEKEFIFSATRSPHYTIKREEISELLNKEKMYCFIDMALPRDIDPKIDELSNVRLFHIDDFGVRSECEKEDLESAREILSEYKQDFINWYQIRALAPKVNEISEIVGELTHCKLTKVYKNINISEDDKGFLQSSVQAATKKAVSKIIFGLRENMDREQYNELLKALELTANNCM
ncbi:glutamyl-tRNA reductase [Clostridium disporicum]|uniref:Glutamyl-tRNA reductase n=1 Tax=Clostridium disporicum TaxID=84024 RepID=A0A174K7K2_9CLOT|nr:glutamyl-tRNA reductase [Clostridium disporicum]CUP08133.1 glutamyl-tRNA reductase [Clostridium disporicum]